MGRSDPGRGTLHTPLGTENVTQRTAHLEQLVFELLMLLELVMLETDGCDAMRLMETQTYARVRELYKSLCKGRRLDGTKY